MEALRSLVAQSFSDWEAVVIDDGSDENIAPAIPNDARVRLLRQENEGLSAARNAGIAATRGPLVAFLDSDDVWYPKKLEHQARAFTDDAAVLCSTGFERIDENGDPTGPGFEGHNSSYVALLSGNGLCVSTVAVRRTALDEVGGFDIRLDQAQDWDLWLRLARAGRLARIDEVLAGYRVHGRNMSANYDRFRRESLSILDACERRAVAAGDASALSAVRQGKARVRELAGVQAFDVFRETRSPRAFLDALRNAPRYTTRATLNKLRSSNT